MWKGESCVGGDKDWTLDTPGCSSSFARNTQGHSRVNVNTERFGVFSASIESVTCPSTRLTVCLIAHKCTSVDGEWGGGGGGEEGTSRTVYLKIVSCSFFILFPSVYDLCSRDFLTNLCIVLVLLCFGVYLHHVTAF